MPSSSRIVFAEDLGVTSPWTPTVIEGDRREGMDRRVTPERRADAKPAVPTYEDGLRDGYARGLEEALLQGRQARHAEIEAIAQRGDALVAALTAQLAALQSSLAGDLTQLGVEIARSAFGAALRVRDDAVVPAVNAALAAIVDDRARPILRVHPDDALLLGEQLGPLLEARGAQLVPDDSVLPGGCRVETPRQAVDATVQTRWRKALAALGQDDAWVEA
jgi:flagellar assembly protein FliH